MISIINYCPKLNHLQLIVYSSQSYILISLLYSSGQGKVYYTPPDNPHNHRITYLLNDITDRTPFSTYDKLATIYHALISLDMTSYHNILSHILPLLDICLTAVMLYNMAPQVPAHTMNFEYRTQIKCLLKIS